MFACKTRVYYQIPLHISTRNPSVEFCPAELINYSLTAEQFNKIIIPHNDHFVKTQLSLVLPEFWFVENFIVT